MLRCLQDVVEIAGFGVQLLGSIVQAAGTVPIDSCLVAQLILQLSISLLRISEAVLHQGQHPVQVAILVHGVAKGLLALQV